MSEISPTGVSIAAPGYKNDTTPPPAAGQAIPTRRPSELTEEELDRLLKSGFASEVKVDRVLVPAVVLDRKGRTVPGLRAEDFHLSEDRVPQRIDFFHSDTSEGISLAFLLDVSGSMRLLDKIGEAREAIRFFLDSLRPRDQVQLMTFADGQVDTLAPFGTRIETVRAHLAAMKAYGQTALNDAIAATPGIVDAERPGRKAIVLITDGVDNFSHLALFDALSAARRVDVPFYSIGFASHPSTLELEPAEENLNAEILKRVAEETGGRFFMIHDPDELKDAIEQVQEDLRSQYMLGYTPPRTECDGTYHRIDLKVGKDRYQVRTRKGYFAGPC